MENRIAARRNEFTTKIIDGCIKNDLLETTPITRLHFKLANGEYARVFVMTVTHEEMRNIQICEGCVIVIDNDYTLKYIDITLLGGFEQEEYSFEEWCDIPNSEKVKGNYDRYISTVVYECIIGGVSAIL